MVLTMIHIILFVNGIDVRILTMSDMKDTLSNKMEVLNTVYVHLLYNKIEIISYFMNPGSSVQ